MLPLKMHNPPHPGEILKELYLDLLHLTVTETAAGLKITRKTLCAFLNGRAGISPEMALKLAVAFDTTPEHWLNYSKFIPSGKPGKRLTYKTWEIFGISLNLPTR